MASDSVKVIPKNTTIRACFLAIVNRKQLNLDLSVINIMLKNDLSMKFDEMDPRLVSIIPCLLVYYMKNWPGWQKSKEYYSGNIQFKDWYQKFREYITLKLNFVIQNGFSDAMQALKDSGHTQFDDSQTNPSAECQTEPTISADEIKMRLPTEFSNNIVFLAENDDVIMKRHEGNSWPANIFTDLVLFNFPSIETIYSSQGLVFSRTVYFTYERYLSSDPIGKPPNEPAGSIELISLIDPATTTRRVYSLNLLREYGSQLLTRLEFALKKSPKNTLPPNIRNQTAMMLNNLLGDVAELKQDDSIATNTYVIFNVGGSVYQRNKSVTRSSSSTAGSVTFNEFISPKVLLIFQEFKGEVEDETAEKILFTYFTENLAHCDTEHMPSVLAPILTYKCITCKVGPYTKGEIIDHIVHSHSMEKPVFCPVCKKHFNVLELALKRFVHDCIN